jgi:hypothetical protein
MVIHGHVENGVVIPHGNLSLPNGTEVTIVLREPTDKSARQSELSQTGGHRIEVPLVRGKNPGSLNLTSERIGQILDEEDAAPGR